MPFIKETIPNKKEEEDFSDEEFSDDDEAALLAEMQNETAEFKKITWNKKLGAFYSA